MLKWHSDLEIQRVELVAVIELVSGSPLKLRHAPVDSC
jgi:hypothetical protein